MNKVKYASILKRTISFTIDDFIVSFLFIAIFYEQIAALKSVEALTLFLQQNLFYLLLLKIIYHTFFIGVYGKTVGKYIVKIKAVDENSLEVIGINRAFLRAAVRTLGEMFFYFTFIFAFFDEKNQTLHDKIVKCVVIDE